MTMDFGEILLEAHDVLCGLVEWKEGLGDSDPRVCEMMEVQMHVGYGHLFITIGAVNVWDSEDDEPDTLDLEICKSRFRDSMSGIYDQILLGE